MNGNGTQKAGSQSFDVGGHIGKLHLLNNPVGPYELRIDCDGRWFHGGIEIVRKDIVRLFSENLRRSEGGAYSLRIGTDEAPVVVEDAPFVVLRVEEHSGKLFLLLNDDSSETLLPETLTVKRGNVPYCRVRGNLEAKFSRQAYYQLAKHIDFVEESGSYFLTISGKRQKLEL